MFHPKATTYEQMEKTTPKDKKFKRNAYEEIRKLVDDNEGNNVVKDARNEPRVLRDIKKKKNNNKGNTYNFSIIFN